MASLKEVKTRISTVNNTRKITSAMKMVASSKLHRAQRAIEGMRPYERSLERIMDTFVSNAEGDVETPFTAQREVKRAVIVLYTSNSSLCGGFNGNAIKAFRRAAERYKADGVEITDVYAMGRKGYEAVTKLGFSNAHDCSDVMDHPTYAAASSIGETLMEAYAKGNVDEVLMIYHHFKSSSTQVLTEENFLPMMLGSTPSHAPSLQAEEATKQSDKQNDYIVEPSNEEVLEELIPKSLHLKLFTALLDSLASEHAARVIAMQVATDNADDLLHELTLTYNKTRQQAITNELLDIVAGSMK